MGFNDEYLKLRKKRLEEQTSNKTQAQQIQTVLLDTLYPKSGTNSTSEDIAPVRPTTDTTEKKQTTTTDERKWFQKGAFEDGYQFGDILKTIDSSAKDLETNIMAGVLGIGEGVVDAGAYLVGGIGSLFNKDFGEKTKEFISKDLYDQEEIARMIVGARTPLAWFDKDIMKEENSVFGEKTDSLAQSGGQLLGTSALQAVGVPWFLTTGATSFGGEVDNAFDQDANYGQAGLSAAITAGAEILSEKFSGGISFGAGTIDDLWMKQLTTKISNKALRTAAKFGLDVVGEGLEEVGSQFFSNLGTALYREENLGEILFSEEALDGYLESFIGGGVLGGGGSVHTGVVSAIHNRDATSGMTAREEAVFKKIYDARIEEAQKNAEKEGKKLSGREKNKIYDEVLNELDRGYVSTDTIEEVLGGESYTAYKKYADQEDALQKEFDKLGNMKKGDFTAKQDDRYNELKQKLAEMKESNQRETLKAKLSEEVQNSFMRDNNGESELIDKRLYESYAERARRGQAFEADLSKYDAKQQETIKKAVESGILNNTNRTHEFVDMVSKISADKGVLFDFTNNERLKESGFAVDGKEVNGYVTKDGITVNIDSHKALNTIVGHEVTHVLEGTEHYAEMQKALFQYAQSKGDLDSRRQSLSDLYKNVKDADVEAELTADLVGDYLFTDRDFVNHLARTNRNVFQKIYDEIKHLWNLATAGSKEKRELEKAMHAFDKAYKESGTAQSDTKYSLGYHAGDLGKSEGYHMQGGGRDTGHFGTGTYFVGDEAKINDSYYGKRPHHAVEFDNYNLYKVSTDKDGYRLHENLHALDRGVSQEFLDAAIADKFNVSDMRSEAFRLAEKYDTKETDADLGFEISTDYIGASIRAMSEVAEANGVELQSYDEWLAEQSDDVPKQGDPDYEYYKRDYHDYLRDSLESADEARNKGYDKFRDAYFDLWLKLGKSNVNRALQEVVDHQAKMEDGGDAVQYGADSNATVFMKALGYEGIDVRGTGLDNVAYGSVIYDLKGEDLARKNGIGTARYALSEKLQKNNQNTLDNRDKKLYNEFAWATRSGAMTENEMTDLYSKIGIKGTLDKFDHYSADGEAIIDVNDDPHKNTKANNVFVFAKGTRADDLEITRVVRVNMFDEDSISIFRKDIYERASNRTLETYARRIGEEFLQYYNRSDYADYREHTNKSRSQPSGSQGKGNSRVNRRWTFGDGTDAETQTNEIAPIKASSKDGVFFDGMQFSISEDQQKADADYLDAVNRGDTETAQKMVDKAAWKAGYRTNSTKDGSPAKAFHGTQAKFTVFSHDAKTVHGKYFGKGFYFTDSENAAEFFAGKNLTYYNPETGDFDLKKESYVKGVYLDMGRCISVNAQHFKNMGELRRVVYEAFDKDANCDGLVVYNIKDGTDDLSTVYVVKNANQVKSADAVTYDDKGNVIPLSERFNAEKDDIRNSLSFKGEAPVKYGNFNISGDDVRFEAPMQEQVAPMAEGVAENATTTPTVSKMEQVEDYAPITEGEANALQRENIDSLTDADAPPEAEAPYYGETEDIAPKDPFDNRDIKDVGNRKVKAYMYENPEVKPFFQKEANIMLGELRDTTKGDRIYTEVEGGVPGEYGAESYGVWTGTSRQTSADIEYLLDTQGYSYAQIEKGLNAIIEDNGAENNAVSKRIEFLLNDRLMNGYQTMDGYDIPADQDYINLLNEKQITEYSEEARKSFFDVADAYAPQEDIAPVKEQYEAIRPKREKSTEPRLKRVDSKSANGKQRKWIGTSTDSDAVDGKVKPEDIPDDMRYYQPIPNKVTLGNANSRLNSMGYDSAVSYFNSQFANKRVSLDDIALGERLIQEAVKRGDTKTAGELIQNVAILGTELGQKVQALSIIKRLTPEGQLRMLQKTVERGKTKGDKSFEGVEITQEMIDHILKTYGKDGTYDQTKLNEAVEDVKKKIADQMNVTKLEKVNAWRYLSMLGNPKTHIRNLVSNVAMRGTLAVKNAVARTIESVAPIGERTKTWKRATDAVKAFSQKTAMEMKDVLSDGGKYSEEASIKAKRDTFKNKILNGAYNFNSDLLSKEDWWFSKPAFTNALSEYLTANGIKTEQDIKNNPKIVAKAKQYATEQSQIATFRQYSWLANKINDIEKHNAATNIAVGAVLPFKKTPINIAKTALNYSPLGFTKTLTYDIAQVKNGKMEASELVDHLSQNITGTALTLVGYMLASSGFLNGGGEDDKEGKYDYQLGEQAYSINIGDATFSLSWLSPIAMPLFVGANAFEQLVEGKEWNGDVVMETLAQTLDPLSEMSFLSSLDSVLSSYDSGIQKFAGIAQSAAQSYITQFVPTLSSQVAAVMDDTKRTTKVAGDSDFKFVDETINNLKYKIPFLRETLEPSTDIWGNEVKQTEDMLTRAFETFIAPYSKREDISTEIDSEIKSLYSMTGDDGLIPSIPYNYINYKNEKYEMSAEEYTAYKEAYGQTAYNLLGELFDTETYQYASDEDKAEMVNKVYDYARDLAKKEFLAKKGVTYTNATEDGEAIYREDTIKGAIEHNMTIDEYAFYRDYPEKYAVAKSVGGYEKYKTYASELYDIKADKDEDGKSITGSRKEKVAEYINNLDADYGEKIILFKSEYNADDMYNYEIIDYLNNREDISYEEMVTILKELGFTVKGDTVTWD